MTQQPRERAVGAARGGVLGDPVQRREHARPQVEAVGGPHVEMYVGRVDALGDEALEAGDAGPGSLQGVAVLELGEHERQTDRGRLRRV